MKHQLIMEGWRSYALNESYETLVEKYEKSLITHQHFLNVWEENMIREGNELFTEGVMDILKQGFESAKELAGEMKDKFMNALNAIKDWISQKIEQLGTVLKEIWTNPQIVVEKIASLIEKLQGWCKVNKALCAVTIGIVIAMAITALAAGGVAIAKASEEAGVEPGSAAGTITGAPFKSGALMRTDPTGGTGVYTIEDADYNILQGALDRWGKDLTVNGQPVLAQDVVQVQKIIKQAHETGDYVSFNNLPPMAQKIWNNMDETSFKIFQKMAETGDPTAANGLIKAMKTLEAHGKRVAAAIQVTPPAATAQPAFTGW